MSNLEENGGINNKTIFKQTFKFAKNVPKQRISPEGFLIRDCGCVMRFLPNLDNKSNKTKLHPTTSIKNQNLKHSSYTRYHTNSNQTIISTDMNTGKRIVKNTNVEKVKFKPPYNNQHTALYQSTFWMEPRVIPVKYTTEVNFNLESPMKRFTETIDLEMKLVPCPYIHKIGTTTHFKTSIETRIQSEYTLPLDTTT